MAEFTHLHLHTDYSLLDGACEIERLMTHVTALGQRSVAMTDHGNIYGAVHFFEAAHRYGIHPILGCELYVCQNEDHRAEPRGDEHHHLLVLAENEEGYRNLVRITSEASLYGFYRKPRISKRYLAAYAHGLIGFSGCLAGELCGHLMNGNYGAARHTAAQYQDIFGRGNFFLEIQDQGIEEERRIRTDILSLERELGIPLVATNDSHYVAAGDSHAHDVLLCVQTAASIHDPKRFRFSSDQFYVKSADEMARLFPDIPQALSRTMEIAERCNLKLRKVDNPFPEFAVPEGHTADSYFEEICRAGFRKRLDISIRHLQERKLLRSPVSEYGARLEREIAIIKQMRFAGYFLIVWDFIRYAREHGIPVGPGRGSAAGSLVSYVMEITDIDPLQNALLFERFLNPERVSMPDIDIDFDMNRRGEVIEYVTRKYGREQVAQIITFNTMAAKAAIKDVGRALDMPYGDVDRIAKLVPATIGVTIEEALRDSPQLQEAYQGNSQIRELIDTARKLEGLVRGAGVHAAGVVIAPRPLTELVPVARSKNDEIVTAYDMKAVEKMGLLKMDFLGLTTLTVIDDCLRLIRKNQNAELDLATIPLDDQAVYERIFHQALTSGVFQFESSGMRDVLRRYKPTKIEDLTALNALYRPGPIQGGMIDDFIERKWGRKKVEYELPQLEAILKETLGVIVYQEQVMQIANILAGYSLGEADLLRRAMGKKDPEEMARQRNRFISGALQKGFAEDRVIRIFDLMEQFAGYGFNKSHSAAYALLAYQTAYLKTHCPVEFMAALLTSEISKPENVVKYIKECRELAIPVMPPDVLLSDADFTPHGNSIRFGLAAIKNVGRNAINPILTAREELKQAGRKFSSYWEFCEKIDLHAINKRVLESLIKAGALDAFGRRSQLLAATDKAIERAQKAQRDHAAGQGGLFGLFDDQPVPAAAEALPNLPDWDENLRLQSEKEVLGFFVSGHPLDKYAEKLRNLPGVVDTETALERKSTPASNWRGQAQENGIAVAGIIAGLKVAKSKRSSELYAQALLEDTVGRIEIICFPKDYERLASSLKIEAPVVVRGFLRAEEGAAPKLVVSAIQAIDEIEVPLPQSVRIRIPLEHVTEGTLTELRKLLLASPGSGRLMLHLEQRGSYCVVLEPMGMTVGADRAFLDRAVSLLGKGMVEVLDFTRPRV